MYTYSSTKIILNLKQTNKQLKYLHLFTFSPWCLFWCCEQKFINNSKCMKLFSPMHMSIWKYLQNTYCIGQKFHSSFFMLRNQGWIFRCLISSCTQRLFLCLILILKLQSIWNSHYHLIVLFKFMVPGSKTHWNYIEESVCTYLSLYIDVCVCGVCMHVCEREKSFNLSSDALSGS